MKQISLKSKESISEICFSDPEGDYFTFSFKSSAITFNKRIWGYTDTGMWVDNIKHMAENWKGWQGEVVLSSITDDLSLVFTADSLGHVTILITVIDDKRLEPWKIECELQTTTVAMEAFHTDAVEFFYA